jgi:hypothetical protein
MTPAQKIVLSSAILLGLGLFIVSDFDWFKKKTSKQGSGTASADGYNPDPYMMLEVNVNEFPNASGNCGCLKLEDLSK